MPNFSLGSEKKPPKMKVAITWRRFEPGLKILAPASETRVQKIHKKSM